MSTRPASRQPWHLGERGDRWFDRTLTAVLLLPVLVFPIAGASVSWFLFGLAQIAPLAWRRHHPSTVFAVVALTSALQALVLDIPLWSQVAFPIATYSVARFGRPLPAAGAVAVGVAGAAVASLVWLNGYDIDVGVTAFVAYFVPIVAIVVVAWALGTLGRVRSAYVAGIVERTAQTERARIAREMHDVVAHGLSVIVVQADGARYAAAENPGVAVETLGRISLTGREALADMRQLLGLLRSGATGTIPLPGLADVATLADGDAVTTRLVGLDREVSPSVGLTTYRVVQESLTNVRKHAGPGARATVDVSVTETGIEIRVDDDGCGASTTGDGQGQGLLGMRERIDVHGGTLTAGPRPGSGFQVAARIPL